MSLSDIQTKLHAPKGQTNKFGGYKYRPGEDIVEAVKPHLAQHGYALLLSDEMVAVGDRIYVKATARLCRENGETVAETYGWAREADTKKGMDDSQLTGSCSSYARKYALNGLLAIDDTKDADTNEQAIATSPTQNKRINREQKQQYVAELFRCVDESDELGAKQIHEELMTDKAMYQAVWGEVPSKKKEIFRSLKDGGTTSEK